MREILSSSTLSALLDGALVVIYLVLLFDRQPVMGLHRAGAAAACRSSSSCSPRSASARSCRRTWRSRRKNQSYQIEMLTGIQTLKAFGVEHQAVAAILGAASSNVLNVSLRRGRLSAWVDALTGTLRLAAPLVLLTFGALPGAARAA